MRPRAWSTFCTVALSGLLLLETSGPAAAQVLKRVIEPGKFLAFRGYVVQEDTLICRTPEKERQLAHTLLQANSALDELDLLRTQVRSHEKQVQILRRMIERRDYVIQKQDSLILQLEKLAHGRRSGFLDRLGRIFDRRTFFLIGFITGVYAGVQVR